MRSPVCVFIDWKTTTLILFGLFVGTFQIKTEIIKTPKRQREKNNLPE